MFENTFKNIDDILYKDAGADSELAFLALLSCAALSAQTTCKIEGRFHLYGDPVRSTGQCSGPDVIKYNYI
jgi:hypothetical protein|tara:strand:- start:671 stop:883 length:213 start_codon:yes stop_codon:yes gene_type:complete